VAAIHDAAARGFERGVADYERGRPGYPREAVDFVVEALALTPETTVLDLAAGSGKLTRELMRTRARIVAVEPVAAMRRALEDALPGVRAVDGTAEAVPLPHSSVDGVTVAQAFHWFDGDRALAEIHRVLRRGRRLALVWNRRDEDDALMRTVTEILEPHRGGAPSYASTAWRDAFERTELFTPLEERHFPYVQETDVAGLVARFASVSFVSALPDDEREHVLAAVRAAAGDATRVSLPYRTDVYVCYRV
jgi:ubiquinone/menaquinone biosynthesis C-methylase UbiE